MGNMEANIPGKENAEKNFRELWAKKAQEWISIIENSKLEIDYKIQLKKIIELFFITGYVNNKNRGSVDVFIQPLAENLYLESDIKEKDVLRDKIIENILDDILVLRTNPREN